ncbi:MAG: repressor LexA [Candidatus Gastranaerophilales bacterium]|nr:repressor LexA [Candidatus Gastranaerophilales bacterium]
MNNLTQKQKEFFENLKDHYGLKALSSYEKLKEKFGFKSKNSIKQYIEALKKEELLIQSDDKIYINPNQFGAPLVLTSVKAGFAAIMDDKIEKRISMDEILEINSPSTFVFKVSGDSMCDVGILDGDFVIIKKTPNTNFGDIVLAIVDNEFTLKTYKKDEKGVYLKPENSDYPIIRPKHSLSIFGVAIGITRRF